MKRKSKRFLLQCLIVCLVGFGIGVGGYWLSQYGISVIKSSPPPSVETTTPEVFRPGEGEYQNYCPLCGTVAANLFDHGPIAVLIDNTSKGSPQSGLLEADIIYEAPIEGGLTRLMAIYYHAQPGKIGPIRSIRPYFLDIAQEYTAVPVHCGGSPAALQLIKQQKITSIDALKKSATFWRSTQKKAPYNMYSSYEYFGKVLTKASSTAIEPLSSGGFYGPGSGPTGDTPGPSLAIDFSANQKVSYVYDPEKLVYTRHIAGKPHLDAESSQPLVASNVIVQIVSSKVLDRVGRLELGITGSGLAHIYTQGYRLEATWSRSVQEQKTVYRDTQGNEIPLTPGQTWIEIVPSGVRVE